MREVAAQGAPGAPDRAVYFAVPGSLGQPLPFLDRRPSRNLQRASIFGLAAAALLAAVAGVRCLSGSGGGGVRARSPQSALQGRAEEKTLTLVKFAPDFDTRREACGVIEDDTDYNLTAFQTVPNVGSAVMCCAACAAYPRCGAWTWGKPGKKIIKWVTDACWLKEIVYGAQPQTVPKLGFVSGLPADGTVKHGVVPPAPSAIGKLEGVVPRAVAGVSAAEAAAAGSGAFSKCPGRLAVEGYGEVSLVSAGANVPGEESGRVEVVVGDLVAPHMSGRAYFAESCSEGDYVQSQYAAINLLGKTMRWTTDVSGTGCGCNAAFYLSSMRQSSAIGKCHDYYCDAMKVCGVACAEIDLQEANEYSWMSTMHAFRAGLGADSLGVARGYGGSLGEPQRRDWTADRYGPGALCIDTTRPFNVSVSFPVDMDGSLVAMELKLSQAGQPCPLEASIDQYVLKGRHPMAELTAALRDGMTPVISYWHSKDMLWMDGLGTDGRGPCARDDPRSCPDYVRFHGFSVESIGSAR